jgi:hypothetical protein
MLSLACPALQLAPMLPVFPAVRVAPPVMQVQGGSRRTWSYGSRPGQPEEMQFALGSDGRPVDAEFELWQGPDNAPVKTRVYGQDGYSRPIYGSIGTGNRGWGPNTATVRNTGPLEFPINADIGIGGANPYGPQQGVAPPPRHPMYGEQTQRIQGGALRTFTIDGSIGSVQVNLRSEGMPINAKIEILQGPDSDRQGIELYSDDGRGKPVSYVLELPGYGSTISITNTGPLAFPITASVIPYGPQRVENQYGAFDERSYNSLMDDTATSTYGRGDRYGRTGRRRRATVAEMEMATGRKWHERGMHASGGEPRGPPPRFADMPPVSELGGRRGLPPHPHAGMPGRVAPAYGAYPSQRAPTHRPSGGALGRASPSARPNAGMRGGPRYAAGVY